MLSRVELPLAKSLLTQQLGLDRLEIDSLADLGYLSKEPDTRLGELLFLPHSSVANLYFDTYRDPSFSGLGEVVRARIQEQSNRHDIERGVVYLALVSSPAGFIELVMERWEDWQWQETPPQLAGLVAELFGEEQVIQAIDRAVKIHIELANLGEFINCLASTNTATALRVYDSVVARLQHESLQECLYVVKLIVNDSEFPEFVAPSIDLLLSKISKTEDLISIGELVSPIVCPTDFDELDSAASFSDAIKENLVNGLIGKLEVEEDIGEIEALLRNVNEFIDRSTTSDDSVAAQLLINADLASLISKLRREPDVEIVISCAEQIGSANPDVFRKILPHLSTQARMQLET